MIKAMSASQHIGTYIIENAQVVRRLRPTVVGYTEMDLGGSDRIPGLRSAMPEYVIYTATDRDPGAHSREVPVALRREARNHFLGSSVMFLSPDLGKGIHNDRHCTVVRWKRGLLLRRKVAFMQLHLNAAIQNMDTGEMHRDRPVHVTEEGIDAVERRINALVEAGYAVIISGDWNWRNPLRNGKPAADWHYSPQSLAKRLDLAYVHDGLDWLMWTNHDLVQVKQTTTIHPGQVGWKSDHPLLMVCLRFRLIRRKRLTHQS